MQVNIVKENNIPHSEFDKFMEILSIITSHVSPRLHLPYNRTCWIYNLCGSIKNQIYGIDPRYGSIKIYADLCGSISINFDQ